LLSTFFVRAAKALLCENSLKLWGIGIKDCEDRRTNIFRSQLASAILENGFYVRAR
jgi:hypothetical protein